MKRADIELESLEDMAEFMGISPTILKKWAVAKKIPHRQYNHQLLFSYKDIANWVGKNKLYDLMLEEMNELEEKCKNFRENNYKWKST